MSTTHIIEPKLFSLLQPKFFNHLLQENNWRTIFSGKFGSGKTTFLELFFESKREVFIPITLHPVNYSIASNEDIFEYIKYDLLLELLPRIELNRLETFELTLPEKAWLYWHNHPFDVLQKITSAILHLGKPLNPTVEAMEKIGLLAMKIYDKIEAHYKMQEAKADEHAALAGFFQHIQQKTASLYEESALTQLIEKIVAQVKVPTGNDGELKKLVLIIEDLDRIDPEHIFRILNVFSAHFDTRYNGGGNRFGIDTIVAVCDEENLRNLFAHRYGGNVDYNGYIDKFFSVAIFPFNYNDLAHDYIRNAISKLTFKCLDEARVSDSVPNTVCTDDFLFLMLTLLFDHKHVSLRAINRVLRNPIPYHPAFIPTSREGIQLSNFLIILELLILAEICGGTMSLEKQIAQMSYLTHPFRRKGRVIERLVALLMELDGNQEGGNILGVRVGEMVFNGIISENSEHQKFADQSNLTVPVGSTTLDYVQLHHLIQLIRRALILINRFPDLTLNSYQHD